MQNRLIGSMMLFLCLVSAAAAFAEPVAIMAGDTMQKVLENYKGKRVTVRLQAGEEMTGKVKAVTRELVHLESLQKREFFDAIVDVNKIEAVIIRAKE